jgi:hypothetical protein
MRSCEGERRGQHEAGGREEAEEHTFASLTLEARYGLPPRSGWFLLGFGGQLMARWRRRRRGREVIGTRKK